MSSEEVPEEPKKSESERKLKTATSTRVGENVFFLKMFVEEVGEQLRPVEKEYDADLTFKFKCEYPSYEEELEARKAATQQNEFTGSELDFDMLVRWRVRRCLMSWNIHREDPKIARKLLRQNGLLTDESLAMVLQLPPLVRKFLISRLNEALGAF